MRPLRFLLTLLISILAFLLVLTIAPFSEDTSLHTSLTSSTASSSSSFTTLFNWRTPSSLFPPSAVISLTDDNSTFFLARPAAFGPVLPTKSLSGQLWVGSGFGDEHLGAGAEGELGCSDVPGWAEDGGFGKALTKGAGGLKKVLEDGPILVATKDGVEGGKGKRDVEGGDEVGKKAGKSEIDGTDDYLHHPLPASGGVKTNGESVGGTKKATHADIQSLQESAEIAGKVVLLSRGGCGFLEKAKWVQRRGGVALIVGDDIRGGPLVTMYARGDTSNVTIPSLFTSHTTAHLLSSLIPSGGGMDDMTVEENARLGLALGENGSKTEHKGTVEKPNFTTTAAAVKATFRAKTTAKDAENPSPLREREPAIEEEKEQVEQSWFWSLFARSSVSGGQGDSRRPPSSGNIEWIQQEEFVDDEAGQSSTSTKITRPTTASEHSDGFRIGVQDWRDPDLVAAQKEEASTSSSVTAAKSTKGPHDKLLDLIMPGSGKYVKAPHEAVDLVRSSKELGEHTKSIQQEGTVEKGTGSWFSWFWSSSSLDAVDESALESAAVKVEEQDTTKATQEQAPPARPSTSEDAAEHDGLWVTLTPTSMSSSPFFDTLLVLVVSPLVTLTVVYALLLLRSRIRRRRWRAPKSVVERLPVRTYQTMPSSPNNTSSATSTSTSTSSPTLTATTATTATTPLLPPTTSLLAITTTPARPRSRATDILASRSSGAMATPSLEQIEEKRAAGLAEWRRRYGGKQRECVVCLEEYVDGVSRVMSLPCGHEFHEECITPWLTTRRRTCPICKGDVVRSLARRGSHGHHGGHAAVAASSSSLQEPYSDFSPTATGDEADAVQEEVALTRNDDPAAARPLVSREDEAFEDLERGRGGGVQRMGG